MLPVLLSTLRRHFLVLLGLVSCCAVFGSALPDPGAGIEGRWLIRLSPEEDARNVAASLGAIYVEEVRGLRGCHAIEFARPLSSGISDTQWREQLSSTLEAKDEIVSFLKLREYELYPRSFNPPDPLFPDQWHLENEGQSGGIPYADTQVRGAWDSGYNGTGVVIAIVDTGTEYTHPDLAPNKLPGKGWDFVNNDSNPSPAWDEDIDGYERHGTAVAGISLAASNQLNGLGIAYKSKLVPVRLLGGPISQEREINAITYGGYNDGDYVDIYNNSWGPDDNAGVRFVDIDPEVKSAIWENTRDGRNGLGCIYVWAAGNGGLNGDISNFDAYNASPYTISVGAVGHDDIKTGYSEPGANLLLVAPADPILTTDLTGSDGYGSGNTYDEFNGTSAAAPMVSGVVALMLDARPQLGWRDVQQILALTASPIDFDPEKWSQNGAGLWVSNDYGFGRVDANAAVQLAKDWDILPAMRTYSESRYMNNVALSYKQLRTGTMTISQNIEIHSVQVSVLFDHTNWGDLHVELESPSGSRTVLSEPHNNANTNNLTSYTFLSTQQLKEPAAGLWKLYVMDDGTEGSGTWVNWSLSIIGHFVSPEDNKSPEGEDLEFEETSFPIEIDTLTGLVDPDGDDIEILSVQQPAGGILKDLGEGRFSYAMRKSKDGRDSFSVLYGDGNGGAKRRVIRILDPRPVGKIDLFPLVAGETYELPVLSNDLDPDGDPLRLLSVEPETGGIGFTGELEVQPDQTIQYSSGPGDSGVARFEYSMTDDSDGDSSGWATVVLQPSPDIAVKLDGEDDHLLIPSPSGINMSERFTVEAWIYPESFGEYVYGYGRIFDRDTFLFYLHGFGHPNYNDRSLVAYFTLSGTTYTIANSRANVITLNKWHHVALSYNSASATPVKMYVDGLPVSLSYPFDGKGPPSGSIYNDPGAMLYIGENNDGARAFKGSLAEIRVWNQHLGDFEINQRHDQRLNGNEPGLQLYLPFDQTLEPEAISLGSFKGTVNMVDAIRVPRILPWADLEEDLSVIANGNNGWWEERNLGWLYGDAYPWIYLPYLGWSLVDRNPSSNAYYLYPSGNNWGWLYTSPQLFPWLYRVDDDNWLLYQDSYEGGPWLYSYGSSRWLRPQDDIPGF